MHIDPHSLGSSVSHGVRVEIERLVRHHHPRFWLCSVDHHRYHNAILADRFHTRITYHLSYSYNSCVYICFYQLPWHIIYGFYDIYSSLLY